MAKYALQAHARQCRDQQARSKMDGSVAQLELVTHESAVHAALLMDLLRMMARSDPDAFRAQLVQAEQELREGYAAGSAHARHVLEQRLAFLRSVQLQVDRSAAEPSV